MDRIVVYIAFALLLSLSIAITAISCVLCRRWHKAYLKLKSKYETTKNENIKLQHEVYRLTYVTPDIDKGKEENKNGRK